MTKEGWWEITKVHNFLEMAPGMYWVKRRGFGFILTRDDSCDTHDSMFNWCEEMEGLYG